MDKDHFTRRTALGVLAAVLACPAAAQAPQAEGLTGRAFGTGWRVAGRAGMTEARLPDAFSALFAGIDAEMSPWRADSALSRFNGARDGIDAGPELLHVTRTALALAGRSGGAFDPTVGPLVARWGFGPIAHGGAADWQALRIDGGRIVKARADLTLDLCGIAKGRALDRAAARAATLGLDNLLIDLGGELTALGQHPAGRDWRVAVEHPMAGGPAPAVLHLPAGMAVATSGLGAQSYALGGRVWGHVMDPASAAPVQGRLRSVTVLASDAMHADGWATALLAAGDDGGPALAREQGIAALFLLDGGTGLRRIKTGGIGAVLS